MGFQISRAAELSVVWVIRFSETGGNFLSDREARIRERAYAIWQAQGGIDGRHEDHWLQAEQELGDNEPLVSSDEMVAETSGLEPEIPGSTSEAEDLPPARSGLSAREMAPVNANGEAKRSRGRMPADPLTK